MYIVNNISGAERPATRFLWRKSDRKNGKVSRRHAPLRTSVAKLGLAALIAACVAGCQHQQPRLITGSTLHDGYRTEHPIQIGEFPEIMDIPVGARATRLSPEIAGSVRSFAEDALSNDARQMLIMVPTGSRNQSAAHSVAYDAQSVIASTGFPTGAVSIQPYAVEVPHAIAPLRLVYHKVGAKVEGCGRWETDLGRNDHPNGYSEFGCATQSNLATMVSNPADLLYPRRSTPPDATRRVETFKAYQQGERTTSEREVQAETTSSLND